VAVAAAEKSAAKLRKEVAKSAAELEALEAWETAKTEEHAASQAASFELAAAMQVRLGLHADGFSQGLFLQMKFWSRTCKCTPHRRRGAPFLWCHIARARYM